MRQIPGIIKEVIDRQEPLRFTRAYMSDFGEYAIEFSVTYHVKTRDFETYTSTRQFILLGYVDHANERPQSERSFV